MSEPTDDRSVRFHLWFWLVVLLLLAPLGAWQLSLNAQNVALRQAEQAAYEQEWALNLAAGNKAEGEFLKAARGGLDPKIPDAEERLNNGRPFPTTQEGSTPSLVYTDPATGGSALLGYKGDRWVNVTMFHPPIPRGDFPWYTRVTVARRLTYMLGFAAWPLFFAAVLGERFRNPWYKPIPLLIDLTALAVVSTGLALLGPNPQRALFDFFQDDAAAWGFIALPLSALAWLIVLLKRDRSTDPTPRCAACGYNLTGNRSGTCPECGKSVALV